MCRQLPVCLIGSYAPDNYRTLCPKWFIWFSLLSCKSMHSLSDRTRHKQKKHQSWSHIQISSLVYIIDSTWILLYNFFIRSQHWKRSNIHVNSLSGKSWITQWIHSESSVIVKKSSTPSVIDMIVVFVIVEHESGGNFFDRCSDH